METRLNRRIEYQRQNSYTYGSTARRLDAVPKVRPERQQPVRRQAPAKKKGLKTISFQYVLLLAVATVITLGVCVGYLQLRSEVDGRIARISKMEIELKDAKAENDANYNYVMKDVDLEEIRAIAIEELGMTYATKDQVVLYEAEESDYVRQYEEIPEEETKAWHEYLQK